MIIDKENNNIFIVEKLNSLKNELNKDYINLESVQRDIKQIENYDNTANYEYLNSLLDPIKTKGVKVPGKCPIPSCSFQLHNYIDFRPSNTGKDLFGINPWFLYDIPSRDRWSEVNNSATVTLTDSIGTYFINGNDNIGSEDMGSTGWGVPRGLNFGVPGVYGKYRLVSAAMTVKYTGALEEASGIIGGAITYDKSPYIAARVKKNGAEWGSVLNPLYFKYTNFEYVRDAFYYTENSCIEGLKMLYYPLDNSFQEFKKVCDFSNCHFGQEVYNGTTISVLKATDFSQFIGGFNWIVYLQGTPSSALRNFRIDWYFNFECIPSAEFMNYMPISVNLLPCLPIELKKKFIDEVKHKAISKLNMLNI